MNSRKVPRSLLWLAYLYTISLPFYGLSLWNLGDRAIFRPDWFLGIALVITFALNLALHRVELRSSSVNKFVVLYVYVSLLSAINLLDASNIQYLDFVTKAAQLILVTAVFFVISSLSFSEVELKRLLKIWFVVAFVVAAYALYQVPARVFDLPLAYLPMNNPIVGSQRGRLYTSAAGALVRASSTERALQYAQITGTFAEPTWLGSYLLSALMFFGVLIIGGKGRFLLFRSSFWNQFGLLTIFSGFMLALSLGPYISFIATVGFMYFIKRLDLRGVPKYFVLLPIILSLLSIILSFGGINFLEAFYHRIDDFVSAVLFSVGTGGSYTTRLDRTREALKVWLANPILGVGLNNTKFYTPPTYNLVNNGWVEHLSDTGIIGFLAMVSVFWSMLISLERQLKKITPSSWLYYAILGLFFVLISDIFDTFITFNWTHPIRWFTLSLANLILVSRQSEI